MESASQDERISAFLDGELPPDQRADFERQMADNAELRLLVEELRAVRDAMQALPQQRLEENFAARILQRAERAMLTSQPAAGPAAEGQPAAAARQSSAVEIGRRDSRPSRRPWIWAAVTVAAAVLLMVFNRPKNDEKVALQDKAPSHKGSPESIAGRADQAAPGETISATPAESGGEAQKGADAAPLSPGAAGGPVRDSANRTATDKQLQPKESSDAELAASPPGEKKAPLGRLDTGRSAAGKRGEAAANARPAARDPSAKDDSLAEQMRMRAADMRPPLHGPQNEQIVVAEFTAAQKIAAAGFPRLLAQRGITLVEARDGKGGYARSGITAQSATTSPPAAAPSAPAPSKKAGELPQPYVAKAPAPPSRAAEQVEVIYVEASREQVRGLLEDLRSRSDVYGFVALSTAPEPATAAAQGFGSSRGAVSGKGASGGGQAAIRPAPQEEKAADGERADETKGRNADAAGPAAPTREDSKLDGRRAGRDLLNLKGGRAEPSAWATQIESVPPGAEELLQQQRQQQQPQFADMPQGPARQDGANQQGQSAPYGAAAPYGQAPAGTSAEPNQQRPNVAADRLQNSGPESGENKANERSAANQPANRAGNSAANSAGNSPPKSAVGRGLPAADSAFSQFDSASASGDGAPDRVQAVFVFRLGPPAAASPPPAAPTNVPR